MQQQGGAWHLNKKIQKLRADGPASKGAVIRFCDLGAGLK
jgi:hypothetical protein